MGEWRARRKAWMEEEKERGMREDKRGKGKDEANTSHWKSGECEKWVGRQQEEKENRTKERKKGKREWSISHKQPHTFFCLL